MNQEKQKPKIYSAEFRASSVKLALDSDLPIAQTAKDLGVNPNTLHTWINKYSQPKASNKAERNDEHLYDELKRLKKEVVRLTEERDLLKNSPPGIRLRIPVQSCHQLQTNAATHSVLKLPLIPVNAATLWR
jgi:transposase